MGTYLAIKKAQVPKYYKLTSYLQPFFVEVQINGGFGAGGNRKYIHAEHRVKVFR